MKKYTIEITEDEVLQNKGKALRSLLQNRIAEAKRLFDEPQTRFR